MTTEKTEDKKETRMGFTMIKEGSVCIGCLTAAEDPYQESTLFTGEPYKCRRCNKEFISE